MVPGLPKTPAGMGGGASLEGSAPRAARRRLSTPASRSGRGFRNALWALAILPIALVLAGDRGAVEAEEYSAYSDAKKPVLSVLLSEPENLEDFRTEFGLTDSEVEAVRSIVLGENERLSREFAESERIVESNKGLSNDRVRDKIVASDYDEELKAAVAQTKREVEALLPDDRSADLKGWVDGRWQLEVREASGEESMEVVTASTGERALRCKVFATQYIGYTRYEAALPHRKLKFGSRPKVSIRRIHGRKRVTPRIKEVGPWNTYDNYWASGEHRTMWKNLPRCRPEAEAAYYNNYNKGEDEYGRKVTNPAGVDLTPAVARELGLRKYQNAWVYVRYPWVRR